MARVHVLHEEGGEVAARLRHRVDATHVRLADQASVHPNSIDTITSLLLLLCCWRRGVLLMFGCHFGVFAVEMWMWMVG